MNKFKTEDFVSLAGRTLMAGIFLTAGISKFKDRAGTIGYMRSKNISLAPVLAPVAGAMEIGSALSLITGYRPRFGAAAAALFLLPTTFIFHDFWKLEGMERQMQQINFMKNLAILGGLFGVITRGTGSVKAEIPRIPSSLKRAA